jgi:hypothetical protein
MADEETDDETLDAIEKSTREGIKRSQGDTGSMEEHPLLDRIEADRYVKSQRAARQGLGIRFVKLIPPGQD